MNVLESKLNFRLKSNNLCVYQNLWFKLFDFRIGQGEGADNLNTDLLAQCSMLVDCTVKPRP